MTQSMKLYTCTTYSIYYMNSMCTGYVYIFALSQKSCSWITDTKLSQLIKHKQYGHHCRHLCYPHHHHRSLSFSSSLFLLDSFNHSDLLPLRSSRSQVPKAAAGSEHYACLREVIFLLVFLKVMKLSCLHNITTLHNVIFAHSTTNSPTGGIHPPKWVLPHHHERLILFGITATIWFIMHPFVVDHRLWGAAEMPVPSCMLPALGSTVWLPT